MKIFVLIELPVISRSDHRLERNTMKNENSRYNNRIMRLNMMLCNRKGMEARKLQ